MNTYEYVAGCRVCGSPEWTQLVMNGQPMLTDCHECVAKMRETKAYYARKHERTVARVEFRRKMSGVDFSGVE